MRCSSRACHAIATFRCKLIQNAGRTAVGHSGRVVLRLAVEKDVLVLVPGIRRQCYGKSTAGLEAVAYI